MLVRRTKLSALVSPLHSHQTALPFGNLRRAPLPFLNLRQQDSVFLDYLADGHPPGNKKKADKPKRKVYRLLHNLIFDYSSSSSIFGKSTSRLPL